MEKEKIIKEQNMTITILIMAVIVALTIMLMWANLFPTYNENLKYSKEYVVGQADIIGEVDKDKFSKISENFEIGANKYGYAVFKDPDAAFRTLKNKYRPGIKLIQKEFNLFPLAKSTYESYRNYGWQVTTGTKEEQEQAKFVSEFLDIYDNSFAK